MSRSRKSYFKIDEPLDYTKLELAYSKANWPLSGRLDAPSHLRNAKWLEAWISDLKEAAKKASTGYCASGGIEIDNGQIAIHSKLYTIYARPSR
jgi:hypothetical protein